MTYLSLSYRKPVKFLQVLLTSFLLSPIQMYRKYQIDTLKQALGCYGSRLDICDGLFLALSLTCLLVSYVFSVQFCRSR